MKPVEPEIKITTAALPMLLLLTALLLLSAVSPSWAQETGRPIHAEQMLKSILKSAPTGIGVVKNRVIVQVNDYILDLTGYSRDELLNKNARIFYPTQEESDFVGSEKYRQIAETGTGSVETRWLRKDGDIRHVILSSTPLDASDLSLGVTFTVLDITERKQAEAALAARTRWFMMGLAGFILVLALMLVRMAASMRKQQYAMSALSENRENLATTLKSIGDGVIATDASGLVVNMNPVAEKLCGWSLDEARGKPLTDVFRIINVLTRQPAEDPVKKVFETGKVEGLANHTALLSKDGAEYQIADSAAPIHDGSGKTTGAVLVFHDVTDKYEKEKAIKAEREQLLSIFNSIDEIIYISDPVTYEILYVNQKLANLLPRDCIGAKCHKILQGLDAPCAFCTNSTIIKQKPAPHKWEYYNSFLNKHFSIIDRIINWSDGRDVRFEIAIDITDRKQAEARILQLKKTESLGLMAGAIAHHYNNLMGIVLLNLEMIKDGPSSDPSLDANRIDDAVTAAQRAADISGLMLAYLGQAAGKRDPLYLAGLCRDVAAGLSPMLPVNAKLKTDLPARGPAVCADASQLKQVMVNLAVNAGESLGEAGGEIKLAVSEIQPSAIPMTGIFPGDWSPSAERYACLTVSDTGSGIPPADIDKLFDPFFTTRFPGRGLGLAVVLGIVKAHGGGIAVETRPHAGSVFRVFLPLTSEKPPETGVTPADIKPMTKDTEKRGGTALVVDDETLIRKVASKLIESAGYDVITASDGAEGVEIFHRRKDDIRFVICDLTMPKMNGWETLAAMRKIRPDIPVILCSGYDEASVMAKDHKEQPQVFLGKPYGKGALQAAMEKALRKTGENK